MSWEDRFVDGLRVSAVLFGCIISAVGLMLVFIGNDVSNSIFRYSAFIIPEEFVNTCRASVILGVSLFIVITLQIVGSIRQWSFFMLLNVILLIYLCIIGVLVMEFSKRDADKLFPELHKGLWVSLKRFGEDSELARDFRRGWTFLQLDLKCCGVNDYTDWQNVKRKSQYEPQVPISCCKLRVAFCTDNVTFVDSSHDAQFIHTEGCYPKVLADIPFYKVWQGLIPFEVIGILSTFNCAFLAWKWRRLVN